MELVKKDIKPRDIMTKDAFMNALTLDMALGCSTNTMLHLPAIAHEAGVELKATCYDMKKDGELSNTTMNSLFVCMKAIFSQAVDDGRLAANPMARPGDKVLSMLPMAHTYGMAFEFIFEFLQGATVYFLSKTPSPAVLLGAFADLKPKLIVAVPLIIEKIVRKAVLPKLQTPVVKLALHTPFLRERVLTEVRHKLQAAFGGNFIEIIVGGAAFSQDIEAVLHDIGFNYTVGYGTTECAPIVGYAQWDSFVPGSCGRPVVRMEVRIDSPDPQNVIGEILVRGMNVMLGYYKNEEATAAALDKDGWYHTGDLGVVDAQGNIFIKGRSKNLLLGANGQNIYPEEIEDKLGAQPYVTECVVIQKGEHLYGLVYSDPEEIKAGGLSEAMLEAQMEENRQEVNKVVPSYARLYAIKLMPEEFEKTPKRSIKRYKYLNYEV